jgi:hypothetical protein
MKAQDRFKKLLAKYRDDPEYLTEGLLLNINEQLLKQLEQRGITLLNGDENLSLTLLEYEVKSSWWVRFVHWEFAQRLAAKYFAWKTERKYKRYKMLKLLEHQEYSN